MKEITPSELILFKRYLTELNEAPTDYFAADVFRTRWKESRDVLRDISGRLDEAAVEKDQSAAEGIVFYKSQSMQGDDAFHIKHMSFYLETIDYQQQKLENTILQNGLLEKRVQEMTGFELKTLLLNTLREHQGKKIET